MWSFVRVLRECPHTIFRVAGSHNPAHARRPTDTPDNVCVSTITHTHTVTDKILSRTAFIVVTVGTVLNPFSHYSASQTTFSNESKDYTNHFLFWEYVIYFQQRITQSQFLEFIYTYFFSAPLWQLFHKSCRNFEWKSLAWAVLNIYLVSQNVTPSPQLMLNRK